MRSLLLFASLLFCSCRSFNRAEHRRAVEQLEASGSVVTISGDSAFVVADLAMERGEIWIDRNSAPKLIAVGADTLLTESPSLAEFGYRVIRSNHAPNLVTLMVEQRSFGSYFSGFNAKRLAEYMASGVDIDSASPPLEPRLTSFYFQLFGEGIFLSLNLERMLFPHIITRIGIGVESQSMRWEEAEIYLVMPTSISWVSDNESGVELGAGIPFMFGLQNPRDPIPLFGFALVGYRYAPIEGGTIFRATFTPHYTIRGSVHDEAAYLGICVGYTL